MGLAYVLLADRLGLSIRSTIFTEYVQAAERQIQSGAKDLMRITEGYYTNLYSFMKGETENELMLLRLKYVSLIKPLNRLNQEITRDLPD